MNLQLEQPRTAALAGRRILMVEDEMLVAIMLEEELRGLGCVTIKASRVAKGLRLATTEAIDGAVLDVNVAGEAIYPVARELGRRDIPFVLMTGYDPGGLPAEYRDGWILQKPFGTKDLERILVLAFATVPRRR